MSAQSMEQLVSLCKRRGFIYQTNEIYGGLQGMYDFGPYGVELKNNLKNAWWSEMVYQRDDVEGIDASILTNKLVLKYSGHEDTFSDPLVDCKDCKNRMRADHIKNSRCLLCGSSNLTAPREFNLMFKTNVGPIDDENNYAYLRPETAQQIFTNFKNVLNSNPKKIPFGIAQIGKAFRNEITPRNFIFRVREFEQMELEFFVKKGDDEEWHKYWLQKRIEWWGKQGVAKEKIKILNVPENELSHYSKGTYDLMYEFPHGVEELEGIANRTDFDLGSHSKNQEDYQIDAKVIKNNESNEKLVFTDSETSETYIPYVIEPSAGVERGMLAILNEAYEEEILENGKTRTLLKLKPHLSPVKVAVIPLKKNDEKIVSYAKKIKRKMQSLNIGRVVLENTGNIGKSYRKHDEIGTPICLTIDFDSLKDSSFTKRDRDTMKQERVDIDTLIKQINNQ